jgi:hypothetical protein
VKTLIPIALAALFALILPSMAAGDRKSVV